MHEPRNLSEALRQGYEIEEGHIDFVSANEERQRGRLTLRKKAAPTPMEIPGGRTLLLQGATIGELILPYKATFTYGKPRAPRANEK